MKRIFIAPVLVFMVGCAMTTYESTGGSQSDVDDVQYLSEYGEWIDVAPFGTVWHPYVVADWEPFCYGNWIWTDDGWAWTSYEPYGWLVYHYGYWDYEPGIGWIWIPDDAWWPARVEWYSFGDYTCWAPLPPPGVTWRDPWDPYDFNVWIVVPVDKFMYKNVGRYGVERRHLREIENGRAVVKRAPEIGLVERTLKRAIPAVTIRKQPIRILPKAVATPREATPTKVEKRAGEPALERMVLPEKEKRKVEKHAPEVERKVLAPPKEVQRERQQPQERKREPEGKRKR
jgi:hypothetical protein